MSHPVITYQQHLVSELRAQVERLNYSDEDPAVYTPKRVLALEMGIKGIKRLLFQLEASL